MKILKKSKKFMALLLTLIMLVSALPLNVFAAPSADIPAEMLSNDYLDGLAYSGFNVQKWLDNDWLYKEYGADFYADHKADYSNITYSTVVFPFGWETVADASTVTGKAPNIATFEKNGLVCGSYIQYMWFNYLPNIKGVDVSKLTIPPNLAINPPYAPNWQEAADYWVANKQAKAISFTHTESDGFKSSESIPIGSLLVFNRIKDNGTQHVALYAGYYNGIHWMNHVGNYDGPEIVPITAINKDNIAVVTRVVAPPWTETPPPSGGAVKIKKSLENTALTEGNSFYGKITDAKFTIYDSSKNVLQSDISVNAKGEFTLENLTAGTYYVEETTAPRGYARDTKQYEVTVTAGQTAEVKIKNIPQNDPVAMILRKLDTDNGTVPQGAASLANAEFTVKYYDGFYSTTEELNDKTPLKTWVVKTDEGGRAYLDEDYKVSGDPFYTNSMGLITLPLGTLSILETKAPTGYKINNELFIRQITADGTAESVSTYNAPEIPDEVIRGGVKLSKQDTENGDTPQGEATFEGTEITIYSLNDNPVIVDGVTYNKNDAVAVLTTKKDGTDQTAADLLPYGNYKAKETKSPIGYLLMGVTEREFSITENEKLVDLTGENGIIDNVKRGGFEIEKRDAETGLDTPQGNATFKDTAIEITSRNNYPVVVNGQKYNKGDVICIILTGEDGKYKSDPDLLPYGNYTAKETIAPSGYALEGVTSVDFSITEEGEIVSLTGDKAIKDIPARGDVEIYKYDKQLETNTSQGNAVLKGTEIDIYNKNENAVFVNGKSYKPGEVVATITTDDAGHAKTTGKALPIGKYDAVEKTAPTGYLNDGKVIQEFEITEDGQIVVLDGEKAIKNDVIRGGVEIHKFDNELNQGTPQGNAKLENAEFDIYNRSAKAVLVSGKMYEPGEVVTTIVTDEKGVAKTGADLLPYGDYEAVEKESPIGYLNEGKISQSFKIEKNGEMVVLTNETAIKNDVVRGGVYIEKWDIELDEKNPQGEGTLEGAEIEIYNRSAKAVLVSGQMYEPGEVVATLVTDATGAAQTEPNFLPFGSYEAIEKLPPNGYLNTGYIQRSFMIILDGFMVRLTEENAIKNNPIRGGVQIEKWDNEINERKAQGGATLENAVFEIYNRSKNAVIVDGNIYQPNEVVKSISTVKDGIAKTADDLLPYGNYEAIEKEAPEGYLQSGKLSEKFSIVKDREIVVLTGDRAIKNDPKRGDLKLIKISDGDMNRMAYVPFRITSVTTGESHIIITDINGEASTHSSWNPHSQFTNRGETDENGVWFGSIDALDDEKGALLYDTYLIEELPCEANEDKVILEPFEVTVYRDSVTIDLGTITNDYKPKPEIGTTATDKATGTSYGFAGETTTIVDVVDYVNLTPGTEYTLKGVLMDKETEEALLVNGEEVTASKKFTPEKSSGTETLEFTFDSSALKGKAVVVFERLYIGEKEVAAHTDIEDEGQTVTFKDTELETSAKDTATGTNTGFVSEKTVIIDTVSYSGLIIGKEYTVSGILMDKETGKPFLDNDKEVRTGITFIAQKESGTVDLVFIFNSSALIGKSVVVFERMYFDKKEIATHTDIDDEGQTVTFEDPKIGTTATDKETGTHYAYASETTTIIDIVAYENLIVGKEYTVRGVLMDKETGEPLIDPTKQNVSSSTNSDGEESDLIALDKMRISTAANREFAIILNFTNESRASIASDVNRLTSILKRNNFGVKTADKNDYKRLCAIYYENRIDVRRMPDYDGEHFLTEGDPA